MDIRIKKAGALDSVALHALSKAAFGVDCEEEKAIDASLRATGQEIVFIAYADGLPVGFICGEVHRSMCCKALEGRVSELFVDEKYRRRGIAGKLICEMEAALTRSGVSVIEIAVSDKNPIAQAFYSSCGYAGKSRMIYHKKYLSGNYRAEGEGQKE